MDGWMDGWMDERSIIIITTVQYHAIRFDLQILYSILSLSLASLYATLLYSADIDTAIAATM